MTSQVAGGQASFVWKYMFIRLLLTIKENLVSKIMQSAYLCVIFLVKHKNLPFLAVLTWFLILSKIQDQWRRPLLVTSQASTSATTPKIKVKSFQNSAIYQKRRGGVLSTLPTPPPLLYHGGGMNLRGEPCKVKQTTNVLRMLNILTGLFYTGSRKVHCSSL